jgi:thiamine biosynthesis lipoprotein
VYKYRQGNSATAEAMKVEGKTMGTTYHITYFDTKKRDFKGSIDSLLSVVNKSINNYDPTSEVSQFNKSSVGIKVALPYLIPPLEVGREVHAMSDGAFDPTVMPLVNAWGFGPGKRVKADAAFIDSVKNFIGFDKIIVTQDSLIKTDPRSQLDFGGIGQGYGADVIFERMADWNFRSPIYS